MYPLVLLHGFPFDSSMWDEVVDLLGEEGIPTIALDAPGFGFSEVPEGEPCLEDAADAVVATLDDLGIDRAVLAGLSMGGYIALATAQRHSSRLAGLALLDTKASADPEAARENRLRIAAEAPGAGSAVVADMVEKLLGETTRELDPDLVARHREMLAAAPVPGIVWAQRAMAARPDRMHVLEDLTVPGLVVRGTEDALATQEDAEAMVHAMQAHDGDAELVLIPAAGHMTATEDPEGTAEALAAFWRRCVG
ncbi:alpha/beta fold hydrolase [Serinibacter salmoneus]|uniref:Pimeloyl-ACP methyl ester carboxylesterase n=1 Tax=Serinibacter salmoneus TaxID=556530 RepID=A0A2A9D0Q3_9MICO|nr:alpha/beta hydrolase [Serinibacter salmoneus]PFG20278.1 pimeloyl-ACP methyl ester carboxylesterase [Serinibacter salmoneus]